MTATFIMNGCGNSLADIPVGGAGFVAVEDREAGHPSVAVVVIDWETGDASLFADAQMEPIDLAAFVTDEGDTLADHEAVFKQRVAALMQEILADVEMFDVQVVGEGNARVVRETTVYMTQSVSPTGRVEIGRAAYDPCNEQYDDEAIIFGEQIRKLGSGYSLDDWVRVFANVAAHETMHTFGYGHVSRADNPPDGRSQYVELMLDNHTFSEMRLPQRLIHEMSTCPHDGGSRGTMPGDMHDHPGAACTCGH